MKQLSGISILAVVSLAIACAMSTAASAITPEGQTQLEADWLMQCGNKPSTKLIGDEIGWARELAARLAKLKGCPSMKAQLDKLTELEKQVNGTVKELVVTFELDGKQQTAKFPENTPLTLKPPSAKKSK